MKQTRYALKRRQILYYIKTLNIKNKLAPTSIIKRDKNIFTTPALSEAMFRAGIELQTLSTTLSLNTGLTDT
jgi:hypothetical protein